MRRGKPKLSIVLLAAWAKGRIPGQGTKVRASRFQDDRTITGRRKAEGQNWTRDLSRKRIPRGPWERKKASRKGKNQQAGERVLSSSPQAGGTR